MKKKYVLKNRTRFSVFVMAVVMLISTVVFAGSVYGYKEASYKLITVKQGDTLWGIAKQNNPEKEIRKYIFEIKKINNMDTGKILAGQTLKIPIE